MARKQNYITEARMHARDLWDAIYALQALQAEWNSLAYGDNLVDGEGENTGYTKLEVGSVVFDTTNALITLLGQGHGTNLAKLL
jgi:hypothetical protein